MINPIIQTSMPPGGIRTHDLSRRAAVDRAATGTGKGKRLIHHRCRVVGSVQCHIPSDNMTFKLGSVRGRSSYAASPHVFEPSALHLFTCLDCTPFCSPTPACMIACLSSNYDSNRIVLFPACGLKISGSAKVTVEAT